MIYYNHKTKGDKKMEERKLVEYALEILRKRSNDYHNDLHARSAYESAISMIEYALEGKYDCLCQFDY